MSRLTVAVFLVLALTGCAAKEPIYGVFTDVVPSVHQGLAHESVQQMTTLYPPAKTSLDFVHETNDDFGAAFVPLLRQEGYSVKEYSDESRKEGNPAAYVVDSIKEADLYHIQISIGPQILSRAYRLENTNLVPVSHWSHRSN